GTGDRENALLIADLSVPTTGRACRRPPAAGRAAAVTLLAWLIPTHLHLRLFAESRFFKGQGQVGARVAPALSAATAPSAHVHAEQVAEDIAKDVAEIRERRRIEAREARSAVDSGMAELVIALALIGVDQNTVGFSTFLELLLRVRVPGIAVGMVL